MSEANSSAASNNSASSQVLAGEFAVGTVLDNRFELLEFLGSGAVGQTYKANDVLLSRIVAIKILSENASHDEKTIERFKTEALVTTKLDHAGICKSYALKAGGDGRLFMVMDFIEGRTLASILSECRCMQLPQFYALFEQIADALEYAHAEGVIHRDLKPGNIMVSCVDEQLKPVIVDFGLVKWLENETKQAQTGTGILLGTSAYMSPEQCLGAKDIDARSDIYSLACVMFECLVGKPPFIGESSFDVMYKHLNDSISKLGQIKQVPPVLVPLLRKGLAKKREQRFQSMAELKHCLLEVSKKTAKPSAKRFSLFVSIALFLVGSLMLVLGLNHENIEKEVNTKKTNEVDVDIANRPSKRSELPDASQVVLPSNIDKFRILAARYQNLDATGSQLRILYQRWDAKQSHRELTPDAVSVWALAMVQFANAHDFEYMEKYAKRAMESEHARCCAATIADGYYGYYRSKKLYSECIDKLECLRKDELSKTLPVFVVQINASEMLCYSAMKNYAKAVELGASNEKIMGGEFLDFGHTGMLSRIQYILALLRLSKRDSALALVRDFRKQITEKMEHGAYVPFADIAQEFAVMHENRLAQEFFESSISLATGPENRRIVIIPYSNYLRQTNQLEQCFKLEKEIVETIQDRISKIEMLVAMKDDAKALHLSQEADSINQELMEEWKKIFSGPVQLGSANFQLFQRSIVSQFQDLKETKGLDAANRFLEQWCDLIGTRTTFRKLACASLRERMAVEPGDIRAAIKWIGEAQALLLQADPDELKRMGLDKRTLLAQNKEFEFQMYINEDKTKEAIAAQKEAIRLQKFPFVINESALLQDQIILAIYLVDSSEVETSKQLLDEIETTLAKSPTVWKNLSSTGKLRYAQLKAMCKEYKQSLSVLERYIADLRASDAAVPSSVIVDYADALTQNGKTSEAEKILKRELKENPHLAPIWQYRIHASLTKLAKEQKNVSAELEEGKRTLNSAPPEVKIAAYATLVQCLIDTGNLPEALSELKSAEILSASVPRSLANTRALSLLQRLKKYIGERPQESTALPAGVSK